MLLATASTTITDLTPTDISVDSADAISIAPFKDQLYLAVCRSINETASLDSQKHDSLVANAADVELTDVDATDVGLTDTPVAIAQIYRYSGEGQHWQLVIQQSLTPASAKSSAKSNSTLNLQCQLSAVSDANQTWLLAHFCGFEEQLLWATKEPDQWQKWPSPVGHRALIQSGLFYQGDLYLRAVDTTTGQMSLFVSKQALFESDRQSSEVWQSIALPQEVPSEGVGDDEQPPLITAWSNQSDGLYAAIANSDSGFELWRLTQPSGPWTQLHSGGLQRYSLNAQVAHMVPFQGNFYVATAQSISQNPNQTPDQALPPAQFELIRLYNNGDWDLLAGQPRFTPIGLRVPLLCKGPGFDSASGELDYLAMHNHQLYLGFQSLEGFQLWHSPNGETWTRRAVPELSQYHQLQPFETTSTPFGLVMACNAQTMHGAQSRRLFAYRDSIPL
ncbi:MAG: hypothetical protein AB8B99_11250 [Phormidesmis sp.]